MIFVYLVSQNILWRPQTLFLWNILQSLFPDPVSQTLLHELGHNLGLSHSNVPGSIMWPSHGWRSADFVVKPQPDDVRRIQALYGVGTGTVYGSGVTAPPTWPPATSASLPGWPPATTHLPTWPNYTRWTTYRPYHTTRRPYYTTRRPYYTTRRLYKRPKPDSNGPGNFISRLFHFLGNLFE